MAVYQLDLGVRDVGEAASKLRRKRHANEEFEEPSHYNIAVLDSFCEYLSVLRNRQDHKVGLKLSIANNSFNIANNSFDCQFSLVVKAQEMIFKGYRAMVAQKRKNDAEGMISEDAVKGLTRGYF